MSKTMRPIRKVRPIWTAPKDCPDCGLRMYYSTAAGAHVHDHSGEKLCDEDVRWHDVYALKQPHPDGSEWIQEFDTLDEAIRYRGHSGGVLVRRERLPDQPGLWWVEVNDPT